MSAISVSTAVERVPASFSQMGLWSVMQLFPACVAYNGFRQYDLRGRLNKAAFIEAVDAVIARHEGLRTTFEGNPEPTQVIARDNRSSVEVIDVSSFSKADQERRIEDYVAKEHTYRFDLERGPLLRFVLFECSETHHVFLLNSHRIVTDLWSMGIIFRELGAFYAAAAEGRSIESPAVQARYSDFAIRQRQEAATGKLGTDLAYWKRTLTGAPELLALPTDRRRGPVHSFRGGIAKLAMDTELTTALNALARTFGVTLYVLLLSAFQVLLFRYSGQEDVVVGSPATQRAHRALEDVVGFFVNSLVIRTRVRGIAKFSEFVAGVWQNVLDAFDHQSAPFELVLNELQPSRSLSYHPLFQVMFALQNVPPRHLRLSGVEITRRDDDTPTSKFDLMLSLTEVGTGLEAEMEYSADLFDHATVEAMLRSYQTLLRGIVSNPNERVSRLPIVGEPELAKLLAHARPSSVEASAICVHRLFEQWAHRTPDAVAVTYEDQELSYSFVNRRANELAHRLLALGVRPNTLVGVCLDRSADLVAAILGVLKAGAAYLPLPPEHPTERLNFMVDDAEVSVVVTSDRHHARVTSFAEEVVLFDLASDSVADSQADPGLEVAPENLMYVIYTSGSTGQPKGVEITHRNVARLMEATNGLFGFNNSDVWTLFHSFAFDFSVWELWGALAYGGRLVVVPQMVGRSAHDFHDLLRKQRVTVLNQTPSAFRELIAADGSRQGPPELALRYVIFGGEKLALEMLRPWFKRHGDDYPKLMNMYGITETTVHVTFRLLKETDLDDTNDSPIGRPIPDLSLYILDPERQPVPVGVAGELFVGGAGLANGYRNRSALTEERFVANPFGSGKLYRTGDSARYRPNLDIEYLGRIDNQIKLRGFRIELGEIEHALNTHPSVRGSCVTMRQRDDGDSYLAAYVVAEPDLDTAALRCALGTRLPEYMVPAAIVPMAALPLTANGKVDARALPDPRGAVVRREYSPPNGLIEELTAGVWAQALDQSRISATDSFFLLGGSSLTAARVVSRINGIYGLNLPLRSLFDAPTVRAFAASVDDAMRARRHRSLGTIAAASTGATVTASFAQQRLWMAHEVSRESAAYNVQFALHIDGALRVDALRRSLQHLVDRHEALRTTFRTEANELRQVVAPSGSIELRTISVPEQGSAAECIENLMLAEATHRFDLRNGPLMRATLVACASREHVLLLNMHHIVTDGWSMRVFFDELRLLYEAFCSNATLPSDALPPLRAQYRHYTLWQAEWMKDVTFDEQLSYWKKELAGVAPILALPTKPRQAKMSDAGAVRGFTIPRHVVDELSAFSQRNSVTLFMTLLAAFQIVLFRYTDQTDIVVGTAVGNRTDVDTDGLIGLFLNTVPVRVQLERHATVAEVVSQVRGKALGAYANQDVPFDRLLQELRPARSRGYQPLVQVYFAMQNAVLASPTMEALAVRMIKTPVVYAKFDLAVAVRTTANGIEGSAEYRTALFEASTIDRFFDDLLGVLDVVIADPETKLSNVILRSELLDSPLAI